MDVKANGDMSDWVRAPPPAGPLWLRIAKVFYDPEEKSFLGRTPRRWGIVVAFYGVFYAVLALMFALCMGGLYLTLDRERPSYTMAQSLIGANPGVAHRPLPQYGFVVKYDLDNSSHAASYIQEMNNFTAAYAQEDWFLRQTECVSADNYGFPNTPCFYIKLNKIYDWKPDYYAGDAAQMPIDMPEELAAYVQGLDSAKRQQVWVSCAEEHSNNTKIEYPWGMGLPGSFYPFRNQPGYRSPFIAVRLTAPHNTPVIVRCRVWAKNVIYNKSLKEPSGYTRIQLYIEDNLSSEETTDALMLL